MKFFQPYLLWTTFLLLGCGLTSQPGMAAHNPPLLVCPIQLSNKVAAIINRPPLRRSSWGILIQTLAAAHTFTSVNAQRFFIPASNVKLLTTAAALTQLGAQFRIRTSIYSSADGVLRVVGRGDPSLTDTQLAQLAQQLSHQGVHQVNQLIAQDDYFRGLAVNPSWEWEDIQADYGAPANSLILNQNAVQLQLFPQELGQPLRVVWSDPLEAEQWQVKNDTTTTKSGDSSELDFSREPGSVLHLTGNLSINDNPETLGLAVFDPEENFLRHLRNALAAQRITVGRAMVGNDTPKTSGEQELAAVESPPLSQLLIETNQNSNNLYAEALLRTLGAEVGKTSTDTAASDAIGLRVERATLTQMGVDPSGYVVVDGSGLSRQDLVSPQALVQTLRAMAQLPEAAVYRASLSVAGMSGTLQNRLRNTPGQRVLQGKTGSMNGIAALSGYLNAPNSEALVFSIIVNQSDQDAANLRQAIDQIVLTMVQLRRC